MCLITLRCFLLNVIITNFSLNAKEKELGKTHENRLRTKEQSTRKQSKLQLHKNNHKTRGKDKHQPALVKKNSVDCLKQVFFLNAEENVSRERPSLSEASEL